MAETQNDDLQRIIVLMQAKDAEFRRAMDRNTMAMKRLSREGGYDMRKIRSEMKALDQQAAAAAGAVGGWGKAFVAGIGAGVVTGLLAGISTDIAGVVKSIASVGDEAKRSGLGLQAFQEWQFVAEQNRVGIDALVDGFKELSLRADEYIVTGAGSAAEAFERLGFRAGDLKERLKDPSALMLEIIGRLQGLDQAARIRITDELFGGTGGEQFVQLIDQGEAGLRRTIDRAHELGRVMDQAMIEKATELDRKWAELTDRVATFGKTLAVAIADVPFDILETRLNEIFTDVEGRSILGEDTYQTLRDMGALTDEQVQKLTALRAEYVELEEAARVAANQMAQAADEALKYDLDDLWKALAKASNDLRAIADEFQSGAITGEEFRAKMAEVHRDTKKAFGALDAADKVNFSTAISEVDRLGTIIGSVVEKAKALFTWVKAAASLDPNAGSGVTTGTPLKPGEWLLPPSSQAPRTSTKPRERPFELGVPDLPSGRGGKGGGGGSQSEYQRATESIREQTAALEAEALALLATAESGKDYGDAVQYARRYAELLTAAQEDGRAITPELRAEVDQLAAAYVAAGEGAEAAREKLEAVRESAQRGEDALIGIFESVLDGSRSAKDALGDLLMEMAKVQLRQAAMGVFGGSGIGSFLGGMLTPIAGARASGGSVVGGRPYLVNENTPNSEVFVPSQGGAILTSAQAQEALRARAVAPVAGRLGAEIRVKVYVEDDGRLAAVAELHGARGAVPIVVEAIKKNNAQLAQAQRRK